MGATNEQWYKDFYKDYRKEVDTAKPFKEIKPEIFATQAVVYRCYDEDDNLLYIGSTARPAARFVLHHHKTEWFSQVAKITYQRGFNNDDELRRAEYDAIAAECPIYNILGK